MQDTDFHFEVKRKIFHLCALVIPIFYLFSTKVITCSLLLVITVCILYLDISRHNNLKISELSSKLFNKIMRPTEMAGSLKLSGMSFMMLGFLLTAIFFEKGLAICSWCVLIISDCLAALVGSRIGEKLNNGKSLAGSAAFLTSAIFISIFIYFNINFNTNFSIIIISSLITSLAEFYAESIGLNDNLLIPLTYCFSTFLFAFLL